MLRAGVVLWLVGLAAEARAAVVINEIDYDQPGADGAEFVELVLVALFLRRRHS